MATLRTFRPPQYEERKRAERREYEANRPPEHDAWFGSARWKKKRAEQLRAEPNCAMCSAPATVCDHTIAHGYDPVLFWGGALQSLCASCHSRHKQRAEYRSLQARRAARSEPPAPPKKTFTVA
jgi:hypothetical protein